MHRPNSTGTVSVSDLRKNSTTKESQEAKQPNALLLARTGVAVASGPQRLAFRAVVPLQSHRSLEIRDAQVPGHMFAMHLLWVDRQGAPTSIACARDRGKKRRRHDTIQLTSEYPSMSNPK